MLRASKGIIGAFIGEREFYTTDHLLLIKEENCDGQKIWDDANKSKLIVLVEYLKAPDRRLVIYSKNTGSWLTVQGTTVTSTVLPTTGFHYFFVRAL